MRILGLGGLDHNGSACVVEDGKVRAFLEVERVTRNKNQGLDGPEAIAAVLARLEVTVVEQVAIADHAWFDARAAWLVPWLEERFPGVPRTVHPHHACHLACALSGSDFARATVVSIDGKGDGWSAAAGVSTRAAPPSILISVPAAHSLGRLWWAASEFAGLPGHHAAGKTMALAAYGEPVFFEQIARHWTRANDGGFRFLHLDEHPDLFRQVPRLVAWMADLAGAPPATGEATTVHKDMAASIQRLTEEIVSQLVTSAIERTGCRVVCLSGGVALNGLANQRLLARGTVDALYVPPCTDDRGLSLGAAALASVGRGAALDVPDRTLSPFLGPMPTAWSGIDPVFSRCLRGEAGVDELVDRLLRGEVVGWFEGRDEAGPRALGHRSILATPVVASIRDRLNATIKRRESFRPFGCSVLRSSVGAWFECEDDSPYMLRIASAHPDRRAAIPAALHVDGTSRLHAVVREEVPHLAHLLDCLVARGHPPLVVNTSLNGPGEPIVHTAAEAFAFARAAPLDALMVDGALYTRRESL